MTIGATSSLSAIVLNLPGFRVLAAGEYGGELEVLVEATQARVVCGRCGRPAASHGGREQLVRDLEVAGRPVVLLWHKRIWRFRTITLCRSD